MRKAQAYHLPQLANLSVENLCYTESMQDSRSYWSRWAQKLQILGVSDLAAALLDGAGSFRLLAAQLVHASTPFIGPSAAADQWQALASLLEDKDSAQQFVSFLREEDQP
ncbi:MAG: hypothetical protein ACYDHA_09295 [Bellilinea sp.]